MSDAQKLTTLAARIRWLREQRNMSAAELCRATKTQTMPPIRQPSLWAIENGQTKEIKADTLFRIAAALQANPMWIKDGTGEPFGLSVAGNVDDTVAMNLYKELSSDKKQMILAAIKAIA